MKKIYSILLSAALVASSSIASAQQLPNVGFESWKTACGSTEAFGTGKSGNSSATGEMRQRPGVEPADWNGSSVNQKVTMEKQEQLVFQETSDVASGISAVKMQNIYVGVNLVFMKIGSVAPGFITLGTPWVYAEATVSNCDGGVYGGAQFSSKPDAITGKYKRTDSNDENSYIIAYLWNGTYTSKVGKKNAATQSREDECRAIMGKVTPDASGQLVAKCEYAFKSTNGGWQEITVPLEYVEGAGEPTKMNVIISGGDYWDRGSLVENTTLLADDVKFLYYSRLNDIKVGGVSVDGFASDVYSYNVASAELPIESEIEVSHMGVGATHSVVVDAENATVTITVINAGADVDGQSSHIYVLQYEKAPAKEGVSKDYSGYLNVEMMNPETGEYGSLTQNEEKTITITEYEDGTCDFLLPNFVLSTADGDMELGDILVEGATVTKGDNGVSTYAGEIKDMPLLEGAIVADVTLNGKISEAGVVEMEINVLWEGIPIICTFTSEMSGVESIQIDEDIPAIYYNLQGVKVVNPENGVFIRVQGGKASKVLVK